MIKLEDIDDRYLEYVIGKGWHKLVKELVEELKVLVRDDFYVLDIKEKFGTLRFYVAYDSDEVFNTIHKYEMLSAEVCELCGNKGSVKSLGGWYKTVCNDCHNNYLELTRKQEDNGAELRNQSTRTG